MQKTFLEKGGRKNTFLVITILDNSWLPISPHSDKRSCVLSLSNHNYVSYVSDNSYINTTVCILIHGERDSFYLATDFIHPNSPEFENMIKALLYNLQISYQFSKNNKMGVMANHFSKCDKTHVLRACNWICMVGGRVLLVTVGIKSHDKLMEQWYKRKFHLLDLGSKLYTKQTFLGKELCSGLEQSIIYWLYAWLWK